MCTTRSDVDALAATWPPILAGLDSVLGSGWEYRVGDQDGKIGLGLVLDASGDAVAVYALAKAIDTVSAAGHPVYLAFAGDRHGDTTVYDANPAAMRGFVAGILRTHGTKVVAISAESEFDNEARRGRAPRSVDAVADLFKAVLDGADDAGWRGRIVSPPCSPFDTIGRTALADLRNALDVRGVLGRVDAVGLHLYLQTSTEALTKGPAAIDYASNLWGLPVEVDQAAVTGTAVASDGVAITPMAYLDALATALPTHSRKDAADKAVPSFVWWWPATEGVSVGVLGSNPALVTGTGALTDLGRALAAAAP